VSHTRKLLEFPIAPNAGKKLLANRWRRGKRIEILNTNQSVPKKNKIVQAEIGGGPPEAGESPAGMKIRKTPVPRRPPTSRKGGGPSSKKGVATRQAKASMPPEAGATAARPSDDEIRIRAYFISERRRRFALPGNADSDWLEAKRQLLSESGPL
jgi:hypothetical protein